MQAPTPVFPDSLPAGHMLRTLMEEHQRLLAKLDRLAQLAGTQLPTGERAAVEEILAIAQAIQNAEPHHQREEQVLFPAISAHGLPGPPRQMELEHVELRELKHAVIDLAGRMLNDDEQLWRRLTEQARTLEEVMRDHIWKEDNVLYPLALRVIEPDEWDALKLRADAIGYCCHGHA